MRIKDLIEWGNANPRALFRLDGIGALVSAVLLGIVLVELEPIFGIPRSTLYLLAALPCFFALYDFICYTKLQRNIGRYLIVIGTVNLLYCILSIGLVWSHHDVIRPLGWAYIWIEILIVAALAILEIRAGREVS